MKETLAERKLERIDTYDPDALRTISVNYHPRGRILSYHTHDFYEINYVLCGNITEVVSGQCHSMKAGDAILMHPGVFHVVRDDADATVLNILIRPQWLLSVLAINKVGELGKFLSTAAGEDYTEYLIFSGTDARAQVDALIREASKKTPYSSLATEGACLSLFAVLAQTARHIALAERQDSGYRRFAAILSYLYENIREVSVSELAARFGYSEAHLSRLFRRYTGESPITLIKRARLVRATSLLSDSDAPVSRIAAEAGFPCAPYFHRLFKATYGVTPEEYRTKKRRQQW